MTEPRYEVQLRDNEMAEAILDEMDDDARSDHFSFHALHMEKMDDGDDPAINFRLPVGGNVTVWEEDIHAIKPLEGR